MITLVLFAMLAQDKAPDPLPEGEGKKLVVKICTDCHGPEQNSPRTAPRTNGKM